MIASRSQGARKVRVQVGLEGRDEVVDGIGSSGVVVRVRAAGSRNALLPSPPPRSRPQESAGSGHGSGRRTHSEAGGRSTGFSGPSRSGVTRPATADGFRPSSSSSSSGEKVSPPRSRRLSSRPVAAKGRRTFHNPLSDELQQDVVGPHSLPLRSSCPEVVAAPTNDSVSSSLSGMPHLDAPHHHYPVYRESQKKDSWSGSFSSWPPGMPGPEVVDEVISGGSSVARPYRSHNRRAVTSSGGSTVGELPHHRHSKKLPRPSLQEFTNLNQGVRNLRSPGRSCVSARPSGRQTPHVTAVDQGGQPRPATTSAPLRSATRAVSAPGIRTTPARRSHMQMPSAQTFDARSANDARATQQSLRLSSAYAERAVSGGGVGWAANRPRTAAAAPRCSDRAVVQPVLASLDSQIKLSKTMEQRAMMALNPNQPKVEFSNKRVQMLWHVAKVKSMQVVRDAKQKAEELMSWESTLTSARNQVVHSKSGSYVRIARGTINVPVKVLKELKAEFQSMDTSGIGVVPYTKLLGRINTTGGKGSMPIQVKSGLMTRMSDKVARVESSMANSADTLAKASGVQSFKQRLGSQVFNFEDMLKMQYPDAEPGDIKRMLGLAFPDKESLQHLKVKQVTAAVEIFNKMDPLDSGVCDFDSLEDVLINEFPEDNVYYIIKTMPKDMKDKLYNKECITMKEFINWYARLTSEKIFLICSGQQEDLMSEKCSRSMEPAAVLSGYIKGHESRVQFRKANLNAYLSNHGKALQ